MQTSNLPKKNLSENMNIEVFLIYVTSFNLNFMPIYLAQKARIALLVIEKVQILSKYYNFLDVFLEKKALILSKATKSNQHAIKLQKGQQPPYRLIYSLGLVEVKTLKTYIETNLANGFI